MHAQPESPVACSDASLLDLQMSLRGHVGLPGEPGYELATPWNVAVQRTSRAVIAVANAQDVVEVVRFANDHGLRVAVQRTGHGATPLADDDVLLVHTAGLDELTIDADARTARIGGGVVWQQVVDAAAEHGLGPIVGSSLTVGVAGFLTGGGVGPFARTHGLASDAVRAFDVVTGDGRLVRATPEDNGDLYWGLRGGKGTLGIVVGVEIDLLEISEIHGGAMYFDGADAATVVHAWQAWVRDLPEHANTSVALLQLPPLPDVPPPLAGRLTVAVRFTSEGDAETCDALLAPMRAAATPLIDTIGRMPYAQIAAVHADPVDPMPSHENSALLRELPSEAVDALLAVAGAGSGSPQAIVELRLLGGAYGRPGAHPSAFSHRDAAFSLLAIGVLAPPIAEAVPAHAAAVIAAMSPWATGRVLPNFAASADPVRIAQAYDDDTRVWLSALAEHHDPRGVLRVGQVVRDEQAAADVAGPARRVARRGMAVVATALMALLLMVAVASADSVAYIKGGDVWLSTSDGARQFQVTTTGGYAGVSQADDGTLLATTTATSHLRRLDRLGNVLSDIGTPVSDHSAGLITFQGPFDADISPDGRTVGYGYIESGLFQDPTTGDISAQTKNGAGFTHSDALTGFTDDGYKHTNDWDAPEFVDNQNVLLSNGPSDPWDDNVAVEKAGSGNPINWFTDPNVPHPMEATISRNKLILATVNGPARQELRVYHDTNGQLGGVAGQPVNVASCFTYSGAGIASPTFSGDGTHGWWTSSAGIEAATFNMGADCGTAQNSATIIAGGSSPDWGPADVPAPRALPVPVPAPAPTPIPVPSHGGKKGDNGTKVSDDTKAALHLQIRSAKLRQALKAGVVVKVGGGSGAITITAKVAGKTVATGHGKDGATAVTLKFTAAARRSLAKRHSVTLTVIGTRGGHTSTTTVRIAR